MDFKCINDKNKTPQSKTSMFSSTAKCERFFNLPSDVSTPPSRFSKIMNPFENRLDRLHLPIYYSPSVFTIQSTPKSNEKFKWTIDEISVLKPANVDEETVSQHVVEDPHVESLAQQKVQAYFSEKVIVPSPITNVVRIPLVRNSPSELVESPKQTKEYSDGCTQTMLSLPPVLPAHVEEILRPYLRPHEDNVPGQMDINADMKNSTLYRNLFKPCDSVVSMIDESYHEKSLPNVSLSPLQSPVELKGRHSLHIATPELHDCSLSPIEEGKTSTSLPRESKSAVRLDFSSKMNVDVSMAVPDINELPNRSEIFETSCYQQPLEQLSDASINWDMENECVSLISPDNSMNMDMSNSNTPHSRLFTSQRKRLSRSFKNEEDETKEGQNSFENALKQDFGIAMLEGATDCAETDAIKSWACACACDVDGACRGSKVFAFCLEESNGCLSLL
ncbi:unnamed protein product [Phyllotreta striolata]|uniref:Protein aurora borealis n=1 Tax=Phyllotreta striolata TaxID=444603 RepID=A0A9N9XJF4_PHYSR|nr:unnamed protein product [Phyllotreta striolata]